VFQRVHEENGVTFRLGAGVEAIEADGDALHVRIGHGEAATGDFVLVGIGVTPSTDFLDGVLLHEGDGGVIVNAHLAAGSDVWAAGDIAHVPDPQTGERVRIEHWRLAQQHGRTAGRNMAGASEPYRGVPFFWSGQFGVSLRYVGHAEAWDEVVVDGDLKDRAFIAYYLKGDSVLAAAGVGRDKEMAALHTLMLGGQTPSAATVREGVDLLSELA
jgi:NADPH-dependent 2,4-dienoyl-CoA reductase/sulfur reductase-like enzyme